MLSGLAADGAFGLYRLIGRLAASGREDRARREAVRAATRTCVEGQARVLDTIAAAVEPHLPQVRR